MPDTEAMLQSAHKQLNAAYAVYLKKHTGLAGEFDEIKLQTTIFQYELCVEFFSFVKNNPSDFARSVSLKGIVHKLFEYDLLMKSNLIKRVIALADARGLAKPSIDLKTEKRKFLSQFQKLEKWANIRNVATGHYDRNTVEQVTALTMIDAAEVMEVCTAFLTYNMAFLKFLAEVGHGDGAQP
jgi:hypothetical protein